MANDLRDKGIQLANAAVAADNGVRQFSFQNAMVENQLT